MPTVTEAEMFALLVAHKSIEQYQSTPFHKPLQMAFEKLTGQLESILGYVDQIKQANVEGIEPMAHAFPLKNVLRQDVAQPGLSVEKTLQNAPETDGPFFKVPKVIER